METENDENEEYMVLFRKLIDHGVAKSWAIGFTVLAEETEGDTKAFIDYLDANPNANEDDIVLWVNGDETHEPHIHYEEPEEDEEDE